MSINAILLLGGILTSLITIVCFINELINAIIFINQNRKPEYTEIIIFTIISSIFWIILFIKLL